MSVVAFPFLLVIFVYYLLEKLLKIWKNVCRNISNYAKGICNKTALYVLDVLYIIHYMFISSSSRSSAATTRVSLVPHFKTQLGIFPKLDVVY